MHRSIGKRIRIDDPLPPEYDTMVNPMTPATHTGHVSPQNVASPSPYTSTYDDSADRTYAPESSLSSEDTSFQASHYGMSGNTNADNYPGDLYIEPEQFPGAVAHVPDEVHGTPPAAQTPNADYGQLTPSSQTSSGHQTPPNDQQDTRRVTRARLKNANQPPVQTYGSATKSKRVEEKDKDKVKEKKAKRGRKPRQEIGFIESTDLYMMVLEGKNALTAIVDMWVEQYKMNSENALILMMNFFINSSGCKGKLTAEMRSSMDHASMIRRMTEEFDEESAEYPVIMKGEQWKKFRQNYCDFVATLVKQLQYSIIYDQNLMDNVVSLLTGLSDSQVRAFRHTATLGAMKLMTALVDVALVVSINMDNTQRQYAAERQKTRDKRATDRLESLMAKRGELEENQDEIKNMMTFIFKSIFVHRYRDVVPEIRAICLSEIGIWMKKFHKNFLDDSYLKYIGWTLHDKVGEVRLKCLQALQPLYASEELTEKLELFTSKFKDRIVQMTLDKDYECAVNAVKLITSIQRHHKDLLSDKDCEHVYELVYSSQRTLAQAAGEFLNEKLFVSDDMVEQVVKTKRGKKRLPNTPIIRDLIVFFIESELHEHGPYLVDALLDSNVMIKDWECMTDLLLEDPGPKEEPLDDRQETSLIEIMTCAVRQASTGEPPVGRGPNRKTSLKDAKQVQEDKQKLTEHFMRTLPLLLEKFRMDSDKLVNLLLLPQYFDLEMYIKSRQEGNLDLVLKLMQVIADKHHHLEVLTTCAKTLEVMCLDGNAIATKCKSQRNALVDAVVNKYKEAVDEWNSLLEGDETPDEDETFNIITGLKKVAVFYGCVNMGPWAVWLPIFGHARDAVRGIKDLPIEAIKYSLKACHYGVMWDLKHLEEMKDCGDLNTLVSEVRHRLKQLFDLLKETIHHSNRSLQEHAYLSIVDLLVVFSEHLTNGDNKALSELAYVGDKELQDSLAQFVLNSIFAAEEQEDHTDPISIEELHKRRNFLAAYCKLIVYGMIPCKCAANIFTYYIKAYHEYGDIIKHTCGKLREADKLACANVITYTLTSLFQEMTKKHKDYRKYRRSAEFAGIKELAKRFSLSFGLDSIKNREAVATIHRKGIKFASTEAAHDPMSPPPNISYLEIVSEFTSKLLKQDKKLFLAYLDRKIPCGMPSSRSEDWQPWYVYRNSLVHGETDQPLQPSKRAYTRKKKVDEEAVEEDDPSGSESGTGRKETDGQSTANNDVSAAPGAINSNRPQRQCAIRSLAYKFVDQNSDEEDF